MIRRFLAALFPPRAKPESWRGATFSNGDTRRLIILPHAIIDASNMLRDAGFDMSRLISFKSLPDGGGMVYEQGNER